MPRRLGSIYCYQRPSKLYSSGVSRLLGRLASGPKGASLRDDDEEEEEGDGPFVCLTAGDRLARSPRLSPVSAVGTSRLVYLCSTGGFDTHGGCMELAVMDWDVERGTAVPATRRVLVEEVRLPEDDPGPSAAVVGGMAFPGLFVDQLPRECFVDADHILMTTQWGSVAKVVQASLVDGSLTPIHFDLSGANRRNIASQRVLCVAPDGSAIVAESDPGRPPTLGAIAADCLGSGGGGGGPVPCRLLASLPPIQAAAAAPLLPPGSLPSISYELLNMDPPHGKVRARVQAILMTPERAVDDGDGDGDGDGDTLPLIVVPHGGPHSCTPTAYVPSYAYLCRSGFAVLHVNYRGSTGFGQEALECLAGEAGTLDVGDVVHATRLALEGGGGGGGGEEGMGMGRRRLDPDRVGICGGSHGGFLAGHCAGQHPDLYRVAALRNPVTNIATMVTATDLPDWCYVETFGTGSYDWTGFRPPRRDELGPMHDASPAAHVDGVRAPTLVALGMADRRVPPSQGLEFYHALRSRGIPTRLLMYEQDDHAIDGVASEADHWINIARWFQEHL